MRTEWDDLNLSINLWHGIQLLCALISVPELTWVLSEGKIQSREARVDTTHVIMLSESRARDGLVVQVQSAHTEHRKRQDPSLALEWNPCVSSLVVLKIQWKDLIPYPALEMISLISESVLSREGPCLFEATQDCLIRELWLSEGWLPLIICW